MSNILIHEVEESLKRERLETLWKEYGGYLIAGVVLAVLVTALVTGWRGWNEKINMAQTTSLMDALEKEDQAAALEGLMQDLRPGHKAVARLSEAGLLLRDGKKDEALAQYIFVADDKAIDPVFRDLARLMAVRVEWADGAAAQDSAPSLLGALEPILKDKNSPWQWHAHVQAALILAHGSKDYEGARKHLAAVIGAEKKVPPSLMERAKALDHVYALKAAGAKGDAGNKTKEEPEG